MRAVLTALVAAALLVVARPCVADITLTRGGTWELRIKAAATACVAGTCDGDSDRRTEAVELPAGSVIRMQVQLGACQINLADYGTFVPAKRGKVKVRIIDREGLGELVRRCSSYSSLRLGRTTGSERLATDGGSFESKVKTRATIKVSGQSVGLTVSATVKGVLVSESALGSMSYREQSAVTVLPLDAIDALVDRMMPR